MMDIDSFDMNAELTSPTLSPSLLTKILPNPPLSVQKIGKTPALRIDLEPIYTQLKAALGDSWIDYKATVNLFVLGNINQAELYWVLQPLFSNAPSTSTPPDPTRSPAFILYLHNALLTATLANLLRDVPPTDVAPWVVATEKPTAASKGAGASGANDKTEERLKREITAMHPRDRRRIKSLQEEGNAKVEGMREMQDYHYELAVKAPDIAPQSAGAMGKTNWDMETRRRYAQSLASETLEFPTQSEMQNRIEPIAAEEGLTPCTQSVMQVCAELMEQAAEVYLKEMLSSFRSHSRSNGEGCVQTASFRRQFRREEEDAERGTLQRNPAGLLPVEMELQAKSDALNMDDMRLGILQDDLFLRRDSFLEESTWLNRYPEDMELDVPTAPDHELMDLLDDCLAVG